MGVPEIMRIIFFLQGMDTRTSTFCTHKVR